MRLFRIHLAGVAGSNFADGILIGALPLLAIALTRDPFLLSLVTAAYWLPWLLGSLLAGVVVDRGDRARIRQRALLVRGGIVAAAWAVAASGGLSIWVIIGLAFAYSVTELFSDLAAGALVPQIVPKADLSRANSRILGTETLMQSFVGQPVGGLLVTVGAASVFGVSVGLLIGVVLVLTYLRRPEGFVAPRESEGLANVRAEIGYGLRQLVRHPVVWPLTISAGVTNLANTAYMAVFVLWVVGPESRVGLQPWQYPLLIAVISFGAILGSLVPTSWFARAGEIRTAIVAWLVNALMLFVPVAQPRPWAIGTAFFVLGFTNMIGNVIGMSIRQRVVPAGLLGRIGGASRTIVFGTMAIGGPLGGLIANVAGLAAVFWSMPVVAILVTGWVATRVDQRVIERVAAEVVV